jgi:hypothetical protein
VPQQRLLLPLRLPLLLLPAPLPARQVPGLLNLKRCHGLLQQQWLLHLQDTQTHQD